MRHASVTREKELWTGYSVTREKELWTGYVVSATMSAPTSRHWY
jgi:hypothetical protein